MQFGAGPVGVWGWVNLEVSVPIGSFPIEYRAQRGVPRGVVSGISGVAYNIAKALHSLGSPTQFTPVLGSDAIGQFALAEIRANTGMVVDPLTVLEETPQTVVLYADDGQRLLLWDQKDAPSMTFPAEVLDRIAKCAVAVVPNNAACHAIAERAKEEGVPVVADVCDITDLRDSHDGRLARLADVLFLSDASIEGDRAEWLREVGAAFGTPIIVLTMGADGALLSLDRGRTAVHVPAASPRPVRSTVGAGDSLLAAFVDGMRRSLDPVTALRRAVVFAGWKVGAVGGAEGFLSHEELRTLMDESRIGEGVRPAR